MLCVVGVQYQLKMKDKDNHDVEQDVSTDANSVQYHVVKDGVEAWILQDFDKVDSLVLASLDYLFQLSVRRGLDPSGLRHGTLLSVDRESAFYDLIFFNS